jgi:uncharacterized small protein (DUF1192 family)
MDDSLRDINITDLNLDPLAHKLVQRLLNHIETVVVDLNEMQDEIQRLRDEIARLKGEKGKPKIKASRPADQDDDNEDGSQFNLKRGKGNKSLSDHNSKSDADSEQDVSRAEQIEVDRTELVELNRSQLPSDVKHRGYRDVIIQNIVFKTDTVRYRLERLYSESENEFYEAALPEALKRQRYGSQLQAFVIMLYFKLRVTEEKILNLLQSTGIVISAGQISNILIKKYRLMFAEERKAILQAGLKTTSYHHIDDTGARVDGVNHYFSTLCNPYYSSFFTHRRKNHDMIAGLLAFLDEPPEPCAADETAKQKQLYDYVPILICDDAPQFHHQTEHRGLCWVHEERHFKKLRPFFEAHQKLVDDFRSEIWEYFDRLKAYAAAPTSELKQELSASFDDLFSCVTGYGELDRRIALTLQKKRELLLVLDFPEVPLDNNEAERAVREYVIKRKISNGTRTNDGTRAWEVFLSLVDTCRKNDVNFYDYLCDRISKSCKMPSLASLVFSHARDGPS